MNEVHQFISAKLQEREANRLFRKLTLNTLPFDFCSNDYLGFARSNELKSNIEQQLNGLTDVKNGSGGSRLLSGNHPLTEETEQFIANFHQAEAGLIFNSGYDANMGILSALPQRGDTIITDELIHASLIDGARLSYADRYKFRHNDLNDLEQKLKLAKGIIYVVVESVYSMDGDLAPLVELTNLCSVYHANLIVDEAHAVGVFGKNGRGLVVESGLQNVVFARIVTFGKAIGVHGAIVLGSKDLRSYLINFCRSFIYTTAAPLHQIVAVKSAYQRLNQTDFSLTLAEKISLYAQLSDNVLHKEASPSAIQTILFNGNVAVRNAAAQLQSNGFDVRPILSPTVPKGKERLRICLHTFNETLEIVNLFDHLKNINHG